MVDFSDLRNLRFSNGMLILPYYRFFILRNLESHSSDKEKVEENNTLDTKQKYKQNILSIFKKKLRIFKVELSFWIKVLKLSKKINIKKREISLFSSTLFNCKNADNGMFNILDGYYYNLYPSSCLLIEDADSKGEWLKKESEQQLSFANTFFLMVARKLASYSLKIKTNRNRDLYIFSNRSGTSLEDLMLTDRFVSIYSFLLKKYFRYTGCQIAFINCACYGHFHGIITKVANDLGIKTVELQHGAIDKAHYVYNADINLVETQEFYEYLPQEIWCFGRFWTENISWKIHKVIVGNPHLNECVLKVIKRKLKNKYLVVSQWIAIDIISQFVEQLAKNDPDSTIVIRLHPADKKDAYSILEKKYGNIIVKNPDDNLYDSFAESEIIIGLYSTCLYEAIAFRKKIVIIDCELSREHFDQNVGLWVRNPHELKTFMGQIDIDATNFWHPDFESSVNINMKRIWK